MSKLFKVVGIGAGNVASHLLPAIAELEGITVTQVFSRQLKKARRLSIRVDAQPINNLAKIDSSADLYILMVHDDAIKEVAANLPTLSAKQFLVHTSGATPTDCLDVVASNFGSFYPLQSFRTKKNVQLSEVPFLVYGNNAKTLRKLRMLARQLSTTVKEANDEERLKYHLSAVLLNNFTNHLACLSYQYLRDNDLNPKVLSAILRTTFDRIINESPWR